jgi:hypothetical protein
MTEQIINTNNLEFRVGTFKEDIFSREGDAYEFHVIFYYQKDAYPRIYYYDNIDYKYKNTFETIAQHIASGQAEITLLELFDAMDPEEWICLLGILEPICTKKQMEDRIKEIKGEDADEKEDITMKSISARSNLIKDETDKEFQIKLPRSSYRFWHPKEQVSFSGTNNYLMTIHYSEDSQFTIFRYGKGLTTSNTVIEKKKISVAEWEGYFHRYKL